MPKPNSIKRISSAPRIYYLKKEKNIWKSRILLFVYAIIFVLCVAGFFFIEEIQLKEHGLFISFAVTSRKSSIESNNGARGYLIKTEGCRIPNLKPFDPSICPYIFNESLTKCNHDLPPLVEANFTHLKLINSSLSSYGVTDPTTLYCCYSVFQRLTPKDLQYDNRVKYETCVVFNKAVEIKEEFVRVICNQSDTTIYTDYFSFAPSKVKTQTLSRKEKYNVLIIGIDSISRLNLYRQMPNTVKMLKRLNAIEFLGFNKVGDNTFPNLIAVLTGLSESELVTKCWPGEHCKFDNCSFIWNEAKKNFFVTAFGEDSATMGIFNYLKHGFMNAPTDYYWDTFSQASEHEIGNTDTPNNVLCVGSRFIYEDFLKYILKFVYRMDVDDNAYFGFFWGNSLSHDYLNYPKISDNSYVKFFQQLEEYKVLNNTVVVFMSDHGIRWGCIRKTYQGQMEERLPFLFMLLPDSFKKSNYNFVRNMVENTQKLTTMYDVYETLRDLVNIQNSDEGMKISPIFRNNFNRSYSLFDVIPGSRTCESAGIESHWCTCQQSLNVSSDDIDVRRAAYFAVRRMNNKLKGYPECAYLELMEIFSARLHCPAKDTLGRSSIHDYTIVFKTNPGDGLFEATVRLYRTETLKKWSTTFSITGTISRINLYGSQSSCITNFHLKLYCYCLYELAMIWACFLFTVD